MSKDEALVALVGSPNVGKSSIFNRLTGLSQHVGNWPGKTIEQKTGVCRLPGSTVRLVDLPGSYSLSANSPEELVTRDYLLSAAPRLVLVVVNATSLERTLYLLAEVAELGLPVAVVVNMLDVAEQHGQRVDAAALGRALGVPVVGISAVQASAQAEVLDMLDNALSAYPPARLSPPTLSPDLEAVLEALQPLLPPELSASYPPRFTAIKLLEGDRQMLGLARAASTPDGWAAIEALLEAHDDAVLEIAGARYAWIGALTQQALRRPAHGAVMLTERLDRVATHPVWGAVLLIAVLAALYGLVFQLSAPLVALLESVQSAAADWLRTALHAQPAWVQGLLADGLLGGVGTVLTLLPVLALFFAMIALLEDVGYLARGAYVADRLMHRLGLHGKSFLPLFLGMGCNVPAISGTRILDTPRERMLTAVLAPLVPCAGRMSVLVFIAGALYRAWAPLVLVGLLAIDVGVIVLSARLLGRATLRDHAPGFIMELPLYHLPNARTIALYTWQQIAEFLRRAGSVILLVSLLIWALSSAPNGVLETSWLANIGQWLAPFGRLMGMDWRSLTSLLASVAAKEQALATLAILTGSAGDLSDALPKLLSPAAGLAFLIVQMLFIPCVATIAALKAETRSWRLTASVVAYLAILSFGLGIVVYQVLRLIDWGV